MIVIPAVDLRGGRCVRLHQGRSDRETVFSDDPVTVALRWKELGAERLHVVDLDGAFAGEPRQSALITKIVWAMTPVPVEIGGGLRDLRAVETVLETGARWAVIGTRAALDHAFLRDVCRRYPGRIIIAVDAKGERVAVKGWTEIADETVIQVGTRAREAGAAALLYTDVSSDGTSQIARDQDRAKDRGARKQVDQRTAYFDNPEGKSEVHGIFQVFKLLRHALWVH